VKKRYIDPAPPGTVFTSEVGTQAVFIPSRLEDNPSLGEDYERNIKVATFGNEALWRAWRHGDWDVIAGAAFPVFDRSVHVVNDRKPTDPSWKIMAGMDWGYKKGGACLTMVRYDRMEVMDSVELERMTAREAGEFLAKRWSWVPQFELFAYSPDMDTESGVGMTLAIEFMAGWQSVRKALPPMIAGLQKRGSRRTKFVLFQQALSWTDDRDASGNLRLGCEPYLVFQRKAEYLIKTIPALPLSKKDPNDVETTADDHGYDALGFILSVAQPPESKAKRVVYGDTDTIQGTEWLKPGSGESHRRDPFRKKRTVEEETRGRFGSPIKPKERIFSAEGF